MGNAAGAASFAELGQLAKQLHSGARGPDLYACSAVRTAVSARAPASAVAFLGSAGELDAHFLVVFTPPDLVGRDGRKHEKVAN